MRPIVARQGTSRRNSHGGPLAGSRVLEIAGLGPAPFAAMILADLGAEVLRIDHPGAVPDEAPTRPLETEVIDRGRRAVAVDLKSAAGRDLVLRLCDDADALVEGFRPGVMERLGIGPEDTWSRNPRLVYGRVTGWGQDGPLSHAPGHDLNYIALAGALAPLGRAGSPPAPPLSLVGDFAGGGMLLAIGILAALLEARHSGEGQVVDAAMVDGAALLMGYFYGARAAGLWSDQRESNLVDGGAPFYGVYETADGGYVTVAAIEPQFYAELCRLAELDDTLAAKRMEKASWPEQRALMAAVFRRRTRDEWCALLEGTDACFAPVLSMEEAPRHPHNRARGTFVEIESVPHPAPAPRFSKTPTEIAGPAPAAGEHPWALRDWGFSDQEITQLMAAGTIRTIGST